jgi:hypothetical protein
VLCQCRHVDSHIRMNFRIYFPVNCSASLPPWWNRGLVSRSHSDVLHEFDHLNFALKRQNQFPEPSNNREPNGVTLNPYR